MHSNPLFVRGDDVWIGRRVVKEFKPHDVFQGRVDGVDENVKKEGCSVFHVVHSDGENQENNESIDSKFIQQNFSKLHVVYISGVKINQFWFLKDLLGYR